MLFMNEIVSYFNTIPSSHRSLILVGGITIFWLIENAFPLFTFTYKKWHHAGINFFMTFITLEFGKDKQFYFQNRLIFN